MNVIFEEMRKEGQLMHVIKLFILMLILSLCHPLTVTAAQSDSYVAYQKRLKKIKTEKDIIKNGFKVLEDQRFSVEFESLGRTNFIPALDEKYGRVILE